MKGRDHWSRPLARLSTCWYSVRATPHRLFKDSTPLVPRLRGYCKPRGILEGMAHRDIPVRFLTTHSIDEHVGVIKQQVTKSLRDPETRQLAVKIVSDRVRWVRRGGKSVPVIQAWGQDYKPAGGRECPPRNDACEITKVWNFLVANCRYVFDVAYVDTFATLRYTLDAGGGDCDDASIAFAALLGAIGFRVAARVISTKSAPDQWVHIYPMVAVPKDGGPAGWVPLDITVTGSVPGWEYDQIAKYRDYMLVG